mmetsp:Transcript_2390/g.5544  ORF Transcript_2390/g.5544 Transcript_2390/m.5544 type:complete len:95 (-) Transcript_2390:87-371(-)
MSEEEEDATTPPQAAEEATPNRKSLRLLHFAVGNCKQDTRGRIQTITKNTQEQQEQLLLLLFRISIMVLSGTKIRMCGGGCMTCRKITIFGWCQ